MGIPDAPGMLDRAPILLGAGADFPYIGNEPVGVRTVKTVEFFDDVQVGKLFAVVHQIVGAAHLGNAVYREAGRLVEGYEQIEEEKGYETGIDDRGGQDIEGMRAKDVADESRLQPFVYRDHLFREADTLVFDDEGEFLPPLLEFLFQLLLEDLDAVDQIADVLVHACYPSLADKRCRTDPRLVPHRMTVLSSGNHKNNNRQGSSIGV